MKRDEQRFHKCDQSLASKNSTKLIAPLLKIFVSFADPSPIDKQTHTSGCFLFIISGKIFDRHVQFKTEIFLKLYNRFFFPGRSIQNIPSAL